MKKTSIASLQERLSGWVDWDGAMFQVGACLGFWPEFGAPADASGPFDSWHGAKHVMWGNTKLGNILYDFLQALVKEGCLETRDEPDVAFRWNPSYKGPADIMTIL